MQTAAREGGFPDMPERPAHPVRTDEITRAATVIDDPAADIGRTARQESLDRLQISTMEGGAHFRRSASC